MQQSRSDRSASRNRPHAHKHGNNKHGNQKNNNHPHAQRPRPAGTHGGGQPHPRKSHTPAPVVEAPRAQDVKSAPGAETFAAMGFCEPILRALREEGYETPTPIQSKGIAPTMAGRDVLGCAQTGTGKTAAFALPLLHRLHTQPMDKSRRGAAIPRALILSPTRELAAQIGASIDAYGRHTGLRHTVIFGGVSQFRQEKALRAGVDILVATPGRLIDLLEQGLVNLSAVRVFVLDEADRMLDMGFIQPIRRIAAELTTDRQTLLFSATLPETILRLAGSLLRDPVRVSVAPAARETGLIEQTVYMAPQKSKQALLEHLLRVGEVARAVVFTRTKHGAERVSKRLRAAGVSADSIHGNKSQNQRERALAGFRGGRSRVLVATDVAARGLDVDGITHVFNFDLPMEPEAYVHRIGRTGRAGARGLAIAFCDYAERDLLRAIERLTGTKVPVTPTPDGLPRAASERDGEARGGEVVREVRPPAFAPARPDGARPVRRNSGPRKGGGRPGGPGGFGSKRSRPSRAR